jgi:hypothetical protein
MFLDEGFIDIINPQSCLIKISLSYAKA